MSEILNIRPSWFVGAAYNRTEDQTPRFLAEGIWENGYEDGKYSDLVRSMRPGDRIAIKSSYTRKRELPFDNRGATVSVMAIKAVGTITANLDDGKRVQVNWTPVSPPREWYFYTNRATVWRVAPGGWMEDGLLSFTFDGQRQDLDRFRNEPFWRERFGDADGEQRFRWTSFYSAVAAKLLDYRADRKPLIDGIHAIAQEMAGLGYLQDRYPEGGTGPLRDICPFTAMGTFNRSMTDSNRSVIARAIAKLIGVEEEPPSTFEGIPVLNNQRSWFFRYGDKRGEGDIDKLWDLFAAAAALVESDQPDQRDQFIADYDAAIDVWGASWNLSTGLYWSHPWEFPTLDSNSRSFLTSRLQMRVPTIGPQKPCSGATYLKLVDDLKARFSEESYPVHSFPELSLAAWHYKGPEESQAEADQGGAAPNEDEDDAAVVDPVQMPAPAVPYDADDILREGCFLERGEIDRLLERLRTRKNLILQGPPGTGKTWMAKRLAFALMGERDEARVRAVQFHPNLSYEDFVRGWRPSGDGKLTLADGVFMEAIRAALSRPEARFVVIIEEINRGNPAQIFGELLTLLEAGKRTPREALELCYPDADGKRRPVHVPENLFVIGTMNIADRSLALVDLAFRRRFAFVGLEPRLGEAWRRWVTEIGGVDPALVDDIERRIVALNAQIGEAFGHQFEIGHSYVTPTARLEPDATREWFRQVAETEIGPLLDEYWFDAPKSARDAVEKLLQGW
ncbi:McrB family protein [Tropicibacter naphthalenivorans]|uniref:5-methylcytosine-specific restriction enzyme B n=1 Tax=Tropicibacter naphthalenivorans TaxID=441103 RepID=A0A0P1GHR9_9RHOB|nr:AAA family ATPase [Tropicibacter naphthalenivorans]CUH81516.1 5-methylcytosine-specific restriction enzyme B [Tropicibacter naphthalenivorans]SMD00032.1 5-methylcytosine-specific restriction enzyme B [Tropicibacter naphthalenivorans]